MRPNLFTNAENAKPCFGRVSAVSSVNSPMVPVVASMGVNFGAGLESSLAFFLSLAASGAAGTAETARVASEVPFSSDFGTLEAAVLSEGVAALASSVFLGLLLVFSAALAETAAETSRKIKTNNPTPRKINRNMNGNLHDD